jgi:hypothetical protein
MSNSKKARLKKSHASGNGHRPRQQFAQAAPREEIDENRKRNREDEHNEVHNEHW